MKNKFMLTLAMLLSFLGAFAQPNNGIEMADEMMKNGKIYVVVAVLCVVFACLAAYLIILDRRISKLEKENNK
jgi:cytochrome c biogenesis factor